MSSNKIELIKELILQVLLPSSRDQNDSDWLDYHKPANESSIIYNPERVDQKRIEVNNLLTMGFY